MNTKEKILFVLNEYATGKIDTETFCETLGTLYYFEESGHRFFHGEKKRLLNELTAVAERFSPIEDEIVTRDYLSEEQMKNKFYEIYEKLKLL